jgi:hypothetical protein
MDAIHSSKTPWHHIPDYSNLHTQLPRNTKTSTFYTCKNSIQASNIILSPTSQHSDTWHIFPRLLLILSCQMSVLKMLFLVLLASCLCCCRRQWWASRAQHDKDAAFQYFYVTILLNYRRILVVPVCRIVTDHTLSAKAGVQCSTVHKRMKYHWT